MTATRFAGESHKMEGPTVSVWDYDPRFRSFYSDAQFISCQEISAALRGDLGPGVFLIRWWKTYEVAPE